MMESWREVKLGSLITTHKGYAFKSKWYQDNGVAIARVSDFNENSISTDDLFYISPEIAKDYTRYKLKKREVIIQTVGSGPNNPLSIVGKVICVPEDLNDALLNQNAVKLLALNSIDNSFLYYRLKDEHFKYHCLNHSKGGANQMSITLDSIKRFEFNLPPLKTQRRIASILSGYDDLIENNLKRIKLLEEQAQQTYEEWFVRFKFPDYENVEIDAVSGLPVGWEKMKLDIVLKASNGKSFKSDFLDYNDLPVYGSNGVIGQSNVFNNEEAIIVGRVGAYCGATRYCKGKFWATDNTITLTSINERMPNVLAFYIIMLFDLRNMAGGSAQPLLTQRLINNLDLVVPSIEIASKFKDLVKRILDTVLILQSQNQLLKEARDILLPRLMSGLVDVDKIK